MLCFIYLQTPFDKGRLVFPPVPASGFALVYWMLLMFFFPKPMAQVRGSIYPFPSRTKISTSVNISHHFNEEGVDFVIWRNASASFFFVSFQIMMSGTILGYVSYDLTHYFLHHGRPYFNYFKRLKSYHVKHHFIDQQKGNFTSVSTCEDNYIRKQDV